MNNFDNRHPLPDPNPWFCYEVSSVYGAACVHRAFVFLRIHPALLILKNYFFEDRDDKGA